MTRNTPIRAWLMALVALQLSLTPLLAAPATQTLDEALAASCDLSNGFNWSPVIVVMSSLIDPAMGEPVACASVNEQGDVAQDTTTGSLVLGAQHADFTNGVETWQLRLNGLSYIPEPDAAPIQLVTPSFEAQPGSPAPPVTSGLWQYTSAQYVDGPRGLRTVGIGGDVRLNTNGTFSMDINFGAAAGRRVSDGTYAIEGDRLSFNHARGETESFVMVLGERTGNAGAPLHTMTLTPPETASFTYTLTKPR
jgi:hypothetical protein